MDLHTMSPREFPRILFEVMVTYFLEICPPQNLVTRGVEEGNFDGRIFRFIGGRDKYLPGISGVVALHEQEDNHGGLSLFTVWPTNMKYGLKEIIAGEEVSEPDRLMEVRVDCGFAHNDLVWPVKLADLVKVQVHVMRSSHESMPLISTLMHLSSAIAISPNFFRKASRNDLIAMAGGFHTQN